MFRIDKRSSFSLNPPEFSCDRPIHMQIVSPLSCTPFFLTITGSDGSGKTSMIVNLLTSPQAYKKAFHAVIASSRPIAWRLLRRTFSTNIPACMTS